MDKAKRLKAIQDALPATAYDPPSSPDQVAAHLLPQDADPSNLNADQIQSLISSLIAVPEYVKKLERKLLALQKSNESKAKRIKELEALLHQSVFLLPLLPILLSQLQILGILIILTKSNIRVDSSLHCVAGSYFY